MSESRFSRWSRKKQALRQEEQAVEATQEIVESPEEDELAINEALPEEELLAKYDLPDPEKIEIGTDITGFMNKEIPEFLRRKALRSLWRSNPVLHVLDGLNDYDEDYTDAAFAGQVVNTVYKVGEGMFKKVKRIDEALEGNDETQPDSSPQPEVINDEPVNDAHSVDAMRGLNQESSGELLAQTQSLIEADNEKAALEQDAEEPQIFQYKPRMRFEPK